jgi:basic membrane protein A
MTAQMVCFLLKLRQENENMQYSTFNRRLFLCLAGSALLTSTGVRAQQKQRVAALFAGRIDDGGFMQSGYRALSAARDQLGADIAFTQGIKPEKDLLVAALRDLAKAGPDLLVAHGGQNNAAAQQIAAEFPDVRIVVTQGNVTGPNLASYEVLQEHSAFLAGALAALTTKTGIVGHMSGIRVAPGLKGRAAYADGVRHINPDVKLLTNFSGNQDDNPLSHKVATAMIDAGADIIFTMLNAGRTGAIDACREKKVLQIGNVIDWTTVAPDVFIASAVADAGLGLFNAAQDLVNGTFKPGVIRQIGLEQPQAVRLAMNAPIGAPASARISELSDAIVAKKLEVHTQWEGLEFATPA